MRLTLKAIRFVYQFEMAKVASVGLLVALTGKALELIGWISQEDKMRIPAWVLCEVQMTYRFPILSIQILEQAEQKYKELIEWEPKREFEEMERMRDENTNH